MTDIVERLRVLAGCIAMDDKITYGADSAAMTEAADEIERLREAIVEWADAINYAEGILFLDKVPSNKLIEEILELADFEKRWDNE